MQANIEGMRRDSASAGTRIERLNQDVAQLRREKQSVQSNYEQQVILCGVADDSVRPHAGLR